MFSLNSLQILRVGLIVFLVLAGVCVEQVVPAQLGQSWLGKARNIGYIVLFLLLGSIAMDVIFLWMPPVSFRSLSVSGWSVIPVVLLSLFLSDLLFYWYHRAEHTWGWLWKLHELHHADTQLNVTTSMRIYWLEYPIQVLLIWMPVHALIGSNIQIQWGLLCLGTSWLYFAHANIRLRLGPLTPVVCAPQLHRIHHSVEPHHQHKNFAQFFPVIDVLFGTYYAPAPDEFPSTGIKDLPADASYLSVLVRPFRYWFKGGNF